MCCCLLELPLLTVSNTHTHTQKYAQTHAYAHICLRLSPLKAHLLRISPWDGTGAENIAAALLFTFRLVAETLRKEEKRKRRKEK